MAVSEMDVAKYTDFCRIISSFKDLCSDIDIQDGIIRQRTDDKISVFEIDLTSLIGNSSLPITNLKSKLDLFKLFVSQQVDLEADETAYTIKDTYSSLTFKSPNRLYMNNKYITTDELDRVCAHNEEDLLLSTTINEIMSNRIKVISTAFDVSAVNVIFDGDHASLTMENQSKEQNADLLSDLPTEKETTSSTAITVSPFVFDHTGDIDIKIYEMTNGRVVSILSTTCGDVNIKVYCMSRLSEADEEEEGE